LLCVEEKAVIDHGFFCSRKARVQTIRCSGLQARQNSFAAMFNLCSAVNAALTGRRFAIYSQGFAFTAKAPPRGLSKRKVR
jgi:hypothetical protein